MHFVLIVWCPVVQGPALQAVAGMLHQLRPPHDAAAGPEIDPGVKCTCCVPEAPAWRRKVEMRLVYAVQPQAGPSTSTAAAPVTITAATALAIMNARMLNAVHGLHVWVQMAQCHAGCGQATPSGSKLGSSEAHQATATSREVTSTNSAVPGGNTTATTSSEASTPSTSTITIQAGTTATGAAPKPVNTAALRQLAVKLSCLVNGSRVGKVLVMFSRAARAAQVCHSAWDAMFAVLCSTLMDLACDDCMPHMLSNDVMLEFRIKHPCNDICFVCCYFLSAVCYSHSVPLNHSLRASCCPRSRFPLAAISTWCEARHAAAGG